MYARLLLGDLFLHGIGGSKYDELTDLVIRRFFGITPPGYVTITATLRLPLPRSAEELPPLGQLEHEIRRLQYHPERYLDGRTSESRVSTLIGEKRRWIATVPTRETVRPRYLGIRRVNDELQPWLADEMIRLRRHRDDAQQSARSQAILNSREYDFCLYPAAMLRQFLQEEMPARLGAASP